MGFESPLPASETVEPLSELYAGLPPETPESFADGTAQRAARNATALALSNVVAKGMQFGWQLALARWLGEAGYGTYGTIGALLAVGAAIPDFGMGLIVIRDVANRPQDGGRYLGAVLTLQPFLAAIGYGVLMIAALLFGYDSTLRALLALAAVNLLVDSLGNMCHTQLLALERMVIPAAIAVGHIAVLMTLAAIALASGAGLWGFYIATTTAGLLRAAVYWIVLWRIGVRPSLPMDRTVARSLLVNGAPIAVTSFLALAYQHADKLLTTALIGKEGTGQLTAGFVIVFGVIELLSTTVLVATYPVLSRAFGTGLHALFEFMLEKLAFFTLVVSVPIAIYISLLAGPLSALVFGAGYTRTADVLKLLIWYAVVSMVANIFGLALTVQNRQRRLLVIRSIGLAFNVALLLVMLPTWGVPGAAAASLIAESVILVVLVRSFVFPADWWQRMVSHIWRLGLVALVLVGIVLALRALHPVLAAVIGLPVYAALVLLSGAIARDDWDLIYRMATSMPGGAVIGRYWKRALT